MSAPLLNVQLNAPTIRRASVCSSSMQHNSVSMKHYGPGQLVKTPSTKTRAPPPPPPSTPPPPKPSEKNQQEKKEPTKDQEKAPQETVPTVKNSKNDKKNKKNKNDKDKTYSSNNDDYADTFQPTGNRLTDRRLSSEDRKRLAKAAAQKLFANKGKSQKKNLAHSVSVKTSRPPAPPRRASSAGKEVSRDFLTLACYNAVATGQIGLLKALQKTGRAPLVDKQGNTPLHVAAKCGQLKCLR